MEIKNFINKIRDFRNLNNKEQIPYFAYFLKNESKLEGIKQSDIRSCFENTNIHLSANLSNYFRIAIKKLKNGKPSFILRGDKYYLESSKEYSIKKALNSGEFLGEDNEVLIHSKMNEKFYDRLIKEINSTNFHQDYTACFILARKLFENMIIDILRNNFRGEKSLYQNPSNKKRYNDFSVLLNNLGIKRAEIGFSVNEVELVINKLNPYRIEANSKTHSVIDFGTKEDLDKYGIEDTFELLRRIWSGSE